MDDAVLAKDLLLGKNQIQMRRFKYSSTVKFFMRPTGKNRRKEKRFLRKLGTFLANNNEHKIKIHDLNLPNGEQNDYMVMELIFTDYNSGKHADSAQSRWEQYEEVAFGQKS
jgi:hypothetical protein